MIKIRLINNTHHLFNLMKFYQYLYKLKMNSILRAVRTYFVCTTLCSICRIGREI